MGWTSSPCKSSMGCGLATSRSLKGTTTWFWLDRNQPNGITTGVPSSATILLSVSEQFKQLGWKALPNSFPGLPLKAKFTPWTLFFSRLDPFFSTWEMSQTGQPIFFTLATFFHLEYFVHLIFLFFYPCIFFF